MQEMISVDEFVQLHDERFAAFRSIFAQRNPPPVRREALGVNWFSLVALAVLVVASVLVSGSRTVVEFGGGVFGLFAFIMLEVAMIFYAYWRALRSDPSQKEDNRLTMVGMFLAFGVSLAANVHSELRAQGQVMPEWVNTVIFLSMAISAPSLALIAGDKLGRELVGAQAIRAALEGQHREAMLAWNADLITEWDKNKRQWGVTVRKINPSEVAEIPAESGGIRAENEAKITSETAQAESARLKVENPREVAESHFRSNPDDLKLRGAALIALGDRIGVGKTVLFDVRGKLLESVSTEL